MHELYSVNFKKIIIFFIKLSYLAIVFFIGNVTFMERVLKVTLFSRELGSVLKASAGVLTLTGSYSCQVDCKRNSRDLDKCQVEHSLLWERHEQ